MFNYVNLGKMISFKSIRNVEFYILLQVNGLYLKEDPVWMDCSSSSNYTQLDTQILLNCGLQMERLSITVSYMTNDYVINVHYKLEFRYIQNILVHRQYQVLHHTWKWRHLV